MARKQRASSRRYGQRGRPKGPQPNESVESALEYLRAQRDEALVQEFLKYAKTVAEFLRQRSPEQDARLSAPDRRTAIGLAKRLHRFVAPSTGILARLLRMQIEFWEKAPDQRKVRPLGLKSLFSSLVVRELTVRMLARDIKPLTATELLALAVASGIQSHSSDKDELIREWSRLHRRALPKNLKELTEEERQRLKERQARAEEESRLRRQTVFENALVRMLTEGGFGGVETPKS